MFRPAAAPFEGSIPMDDPVQQSLGQPVAWCFAALAVAAAAAAALLAAEMPGGSDWSSVLAAGSSALLAGAALGLWCMARQSDLARAVCSRIYGWVLQQQEEDSPPAMAHGAPLHPPSVPHFFGLAQLVNDLVKLTRKQQRKNERWQAWQLGTHQALRAGRTETDAIASQIARDADALVAIAKRVDLTNTGLSAEIASVSVSCGLTEEKMSRATDHVVALARSVRATTAQAVQMTEIAAQVAQTAHATQTRMAGLAERPAKLVAALDVISNVLQIADRLARPADSAPAANTLATDDVATLAEEVREMAAACRAALATATEAAAELLIESGEVNRQVCEMADKVRGSHEIGHAVGYAVQQQSEDIAGVLQAIYESRSGFAALRAGVEAVEGSRSLIAATGGAVRQVAASLPSRAERLASVLRGIPDFAFREEDLR